MIDRSYLPFQSARSYHDRGMAKWMGFSLSEHTNSLTKDRKKRHISSHLSLTDKYFFLGQAYSQQIPVQLGIFEQNQLIYYHGKITAVEAQTFQLKTQQHYQSYPIHSLITINVGSE